MKQETGEESRDQLLKGKILKVYWYLLTHDNAGVREIQTSLGMSSPGIVSYQLKKLVNAGIIAKNEEMEKYYVKEEVRTGIIGFYIRLGYLMVPRFSIYLSIFIGEFIIFILLSLFMGDKFIIHPSSILLFITLVVGTIIFIIESIKMWNLRPR